MRRTTLFRLMSFFSPAFPVGSFTHSSGLEWAIAEGLITNRDELEDWIGDLLACGSIRNDAVVFVHAWRAAATRDQDALNWLAELAAAFNPSRERRLETTAQGAAFRRIAVAIAPGEAAAMLADIPGDDLCYALAAGALTAGHAIPVSEALTGWLHAAIGNLVSAAQRLVPLGQTDGQLAIMALEDAVHQLTEWAMALPKGDPVGQMGSATLLADFASFAHETQYTRLFRT
jgi:urease accessory protein